MEHGLERAGRYDDMIRRVLKEEGVPQDLIYLAQAESAFQPQAVSRAGARGIWQFMPFRGEEYDLERSYWVDERSDPEKATRAAAHHLRDLYDMFGDWYLVMAAYNSGPLNVVKAIERTGYADFWELQKRNALPKQTQNYVPIIIAMALVAKGPGALRRAGGAGETAAAWTSSSWSIPLICTWWPMPSERISTICVCSIRSCRTTWRRGIPGSS